MPLCHACSAYWHVWRGDSRADSQLITACNQLFNANKSINLELRLKPIKRQWIKRACVQIKGKKACWTNQDMCMIMWCNVSAPFFHKQKHVFLWAPTARSCMDRHTARVTDWGHVESASGCLTLTVTVLWYLKTPVSRPTWHCRDKFITPHLPTHIVSHGGDTCRRKKKKKKNCWCQPAVLLYGTAAPLHVATC